jgi:hypothetical protein
LLQKFKFENTPPNPFCLATKNFPFSKFPSRPHHILFLSSSPIITKFLHQSQALNHYNKKMSSTTSQKKMIAANEKKLTPFPTPPTNEKKDDEMAPLLPDVAQCPSPRLMPTCPPTTNPTAAHNADEDEEMANLEDVLNTENKLTLEDKEIRTREKTMDGWVPFYFLYLS